MELDPREIDPYPYLSGIVTPRPIAWITTVSAAGVVNLAPYSFFNVFGDNPAIVVFSANLKPDGTKKDTLLNVESGGEFVINASVARLAEAVNLTSKGLPHDESEVPLAGLTLTPSVRVNVPRVAESPAHLECVVREVKAYGTHAGAPNLVIGEVVWMQIADAALTDGLPDPRKLQTLGRMGGTFWCDSSRGLFEQARPG